MEHIKCRFCGKDVGLRGIVSAPHPNSFFAELFCSEECREEQQKLDKEIGSLFM